MYPLLPHIKIVIGRKYLTIGLIIHMITVI